MGFLLGEGMVYFMDSFSSLGLIHLAAINTAIYIIQMARQKAPRMPMASHLFFCTGHRAYKNLARKPSENRQPTGSKISLPRDRWI